MITVNTFSSVDRRECDEENIVSDDRLFHVAHSDPNPNMVADMLAGDVPHPCQS